MKFTEKVINRLLKNYLSEKYDEKFMLQASESIELKRQLKNLRKEKINIVFVCHRGALWESLHTVFEACVNDDSFNTTIVAIPNKKQLPGLGLAHEEYVSEGAEEFFKDYAGTVINGYDYEKKTWLDLRTLKPDYLFFQNPYDICRPPKYQSSVVSMYTKLCYVHYGMPFMNGYIAEESFPVSFLKNTYFHFAEFEEMRRFYADRVPENPIHSKDRVMLTGYPKLDGAKIYAGCESESWSFEHKNRFRVMWTPRWNTEENNCTFFDYKDKIVHFFKDSGDAELLFRPHPQAFSEYIARKQMTDAEVAAYKACFAGSNSLTIDTCQEYLPSFYSSDVLITDESSIIPEYFLTEKPIIFTYKETHLNDFAKKISDGFYWAANWNELSEILDKLKRGEDSLASKRQSLIKEAFYLPENGSGCEIKDAIKKDFFGE